MTDSRPRPRLLRAGLFGALAPLLASALVAVSISLTYSITMMLAEQHEFEQELARAHRISDALQRAAPLLGRVLLLGAALFVGRRAQERPALHGAAVLVGSTTSTLPFIVFWSRGGPLMILGSMAIDACVIACGVALGQRALAAERALVAVTRRIRTASSLDEIVRALAEFVGGSARALLLVEDGASWRALADSRGEGLRIAREALALGELEGEGRMLPAALHGALPQAAALCLRLSSDRGPMGALLLAARPARRLRARRRAFAQALAPQVSLAWHRLELLEEARRAALARERERVSHEIHDTLAQDLISAIMQLETAEQQLESGRGDATATVRRAEAITRQCLAQARELVWSSWRARDAGPDLSAALAQMSERWAEDTGTAASFQTVGAGAALSARTEALLLGAAREALANVRKHASAREVNLTLSFINGDVALDVRDDGVGFDTEGSPNSGFGLASLRERIEREGGRLVLESSLGEGTILSVHLPRGGPEQ